MRFAASLLLLAFSAGVCPAEVVLLPTWLPDEQRFEVEGNSNELAQADRTLALMRDAFHPKLVAAMKAVEADSPTSRYPSLLGPTLQWVAHVSLPGMTNDAAYFDTYKKPLPASTFSHSFDLLTNRASRLSYLPPTVKLKLLFGDKRDIVRARAVPGVDYPGDVPEDAGSTPNRIRIHLQAPKRLRRFAVEALSPWQSAGGDIEYKWVTTNGYYIPNPRKDKHTHAEYMTMSFCTCQVGQEGLRMVLVFAREKGHPWGCPSVVRITTEKSWMRRYDRGQMISTDYGSFRDVYQFDEQNEIVGFTRFDGDQVRGREYSCAGELIDEEYPSGVPKVTRRVRYFRMKDGSLSYEVLEDGFSYGNAKTDARSKGW